MVVSFTGVLVVGIVSVLVPVILGFVPALTVPGAVLEVIAGIVIGPSVLGWVHIDVAITVLADLGLGMLLFLAGLEIDLARLRGSLGRLAGMGFAASVVLGIAAGFALTGAGLGGRPLFLAVVLMSTSAGLLLPLLKDAGEEATRFGQLVMAAAALAEVATILLLSLLFSAASRTTASRLASLAIFLCLLGALALALSRVRRLEALERLLDRLENRSAQLRVRATLTLALAFGVLAYQFGFASILGAFAAGLLVRATDLTGPHPHPQFELKLQGIGFGFLIPIFFIATGINFDLRALVSHPSALVEVPVFLLALLVVRGLPAVAFVRMFGRRRAVVAGLMEATSLTFVIVATEIGVAARLISTATSASLLAAGLLSAAIFPTVALRLLAQPQPQTDPAEPLPAAPQPPEPRPAAPQPPEPPEPAQDIPENAQSPGHRHDRGFFPPFHRGG
ncbi:MAG TPA: cation:proton antiporter [Streptosporangiaceae bacterium]